MATITKMEKGIQHQRSVKNLGWFFRHARSTVIEKFDMWESNTGWEMFVDFADGWTFQTPFASFEVFKQVMRRQRSLQGVPVTLHTSDGGTATIKLASKGMIG